MLTYQGGHYEFHINTHSSNWLSRSEVGAKTVRLMELYNMLLNTLKLCLVDTVYIAFLAGFYEKRGERDMYPNPSRRDGKPYNTPLWCRSNLIRICLLIDEQHYHS
ncbi:hypothetical protein MYVALT_F_01410 [Candidatus Vallotia tarda]|uniref:Uncharacterized protein n=1 Tax=Candidatus Vallotiella hemipterorum TaxID=1177213 RepID=A0A916NUV5_9BURK|nr:hypothetical protein MYVALT_F_01410 [Candidatus Vallotia tarda]